jgi:hypothetical protein
VDGRFKGFGEPLQPPSRIQIGRPGPGKIVV